MQQIRKCPERVTKWIQTRMLSAGEDGAPLRLFKLSHVQEGTSKPATLNDHELSDGDTAEAIASDFYRQACEDADSHGGGTHRYTVRAFYGEGEEIEASQARIVFPVMANDEDTDELGQMSPTEKGMTIQLMRHQEAVVRNNTMLTGDVVRGLAEMVGTAHTEMRMMMGQLVNMTQIVQDALDRRTERELVVRREVTHEKRIEKLIEKAEVYLPALLMSRDGGAPAMHQPALVALVKSIGSDRARMDQFLSLLTEDERMIMLPLMVSIKEAEIAEEERKKKEAEDEKSTVQAITLVK